MLTASSTCYDETILTTLDNVVLYCLGPILVHLKGRLAVNKDELASGKLLVTKVGAKVTANKSQVG